MDDLTFKREHLRRDLVTSMDMLAKAAETEEEVDDLGAAARIMVTMATSATEYAAAVKDRAGIS